MKTKSNLVRWVVLPLALAIACGLTSTRAIAADAAATAAVHMDTFASLTARVILHSASSRPRRSRTGPAIVIMFNTSAIPTGDYRVKAPGWCKEF